MKKVKKSSYYLWLDTEYTSLDHEKANLLQVALVITTPDLKRIVPQENDFRAWIRLPRGARVSPWVKTNLSDLLAVCRSEKALPIQKVNQALGAYLDRNIGKACIDSSEKPILAGNSVQYDWLLARAYLPSLVKRIHYRFVDVTSFKVIWQDHYRGKPFDKEDTKLINLYCPVGRIREEAARHDAYYDILTSIAELNYYRKHLRKIAGKK